MPIKSMELICAPCPKCMEVEQKLRDIVKSLEAIYRIKIPFEFIHTKNLLNISKYSLNASQTPVLLINGNVEFAGKLDWILIRKRLEAFHKTDF